MGTWWRPGRLLIMPTNLANFSNRGKDFIGISNRIFIDGGEVTSKYYDKDSQVLYIGGTFTSVNGQSRIGFAAVTSNGTLLPITLNTNSGATVKAIYVRDGYVYIGGNFSSINGTSRAYIARSDMFGIVDSWGPELNGEVRDITFRVSDIAICGGYTTINGRVSTGLSIINLDGTPSTYQLTTSDVINTLDYNLYMDRLYVGGSVRQINGFQNLGIVSSTTLEALPEFDFRNRVNGPVLDVVYDGTGLYIVGSFTKVDDQERLGAAYILLSGQLSSWQANLTKSSGVASGISIVRDASTNILYIGGDFEFVNGISRSNLVAINSSGVLQSWAPSTNGIVQKLYQSGSIIYIGGAFTQLAGSTRNYAGAINTSGTLQSWNPNLNGQMLDIVIMNSLAYIAGSFTTVGGVSKLRLARVNPTTGAVDSTFTFNLNNTARALKARSYYAQPTIIVVGDFTSVTVSSGTSTSVTRSSEFDASGLRYSVIGSLFGTGRTAEVRSSTTQELVIVGGVGGTNPSVSWFSATGSYVSKILKIPGMDALIIAGSFSIAGGMRVAGNPNGGIAAFSGNSANSAYVSNTFLSPNEVTKVISHLDNVYALGPFTTNSPNQSYIIKLDSNGNRDTQFIGYPASFTTDISISGDGEMLAVSGRFGVWFDSYTAYLNNQSTPSLKIAFIDSNDGSISLTHTMNDYTISSQPTYSSSSPLVISEENCFIQIYPRKLSTDPSSVRAWDTRYSDVRNS